MLSLFLDVKNSSLALFVLARCIYVSCERVVYRENNALLHALIVFLALDVLSTRIEYLISNNEFTLITLMAF